MRTCKLNHINNFIVISDVHLRDPEDELTKLFITTLKKILAQKINGDISLDSIFLLGDIFDFFHASKIYFFKKWNVLFSVLEEIKKNNIKIIFIEGNHDFGFEHFRLKTINNFIDTYGDMSIEFDHVLMGKVILKHGDDIICPPSYLKFRKLVKGKFFQKIVSALFPGFFLFYLFSFVAKLSRSKDKYRTLSNTFMRNCLIQFLQEYQQTNNNSAVNSLILGHVHIDKNEHIENTHLIIGPDWLSTPTYLYCSESNLPKRIYIQTP